MLKELKDTCTQWPSQVAKFGQTVERTLEDGTKVVTKCRHLGCRKHGRVRVPGRYNSWVDHATLD